MGLRLNNARKNFRSDLRMGRKRRWRGVRFAGGKNEARLFQETERAIESAYRSINNFQKNVMERLVDPIDGYTRPSPLKDKIKKYNAFMKDMFTKLYVGFKEIATGFYEMHKDD